MMLADNRKATLQAIHTDAVVVVYPLPKPLFVVGVRSSRFWSTSPAYLASSSVTPAGSVHKSWGGQCGAVEEMVCVMCMGVAEGA